MATPPQSQGGPQGILYFDPNETTAKLATATLRLAGYEVFSANNKVDAVSLCKAHGPAGDKQIAAILLDASADPKLSTSVLAGLAALPGSAELPGILMVSRRNLNPIPAADGLPKIRRPFSSPALLKVVNRALAEHSQARDEPRAHKPGEREAALRMILERHLGELSFEDGTIAKMLAELEASEQVPNPSGDQTLEADLSRLSLGAVLEMLDKAGVSGVVTVDGPERHGELHIDQGRLRLGAYRGKDEDLKLGRFVVEGGFMRHEELEAYVIGRDPEGRPLGRRLVEGGFLNRDDLARVVLNQSREIGCHLLGFSEGTVAFRPSPEQHPLVAWLSDTATSDLHLREILLDGLRRLEEVATMGPHMPTVEDVFLRLDEQVAKLGREIFDSAELAVLELVNGRNSLKEIARRTRTGTFAVAKVLYRLNKAKVVRRRVTPVTV